MDLMLTLTQTTLPNKEKILDAEDIHMCDAAKVNVHVYPSLVPRLQCQAFVLYRECWLRGASHGVKYEVCVNHCVHNHWLMSREPPPR